MFQTLLLLHSSLRWLVLASLMYSIYRAYIGYNSKAAFTKTDNALRHWTATFAHIQLMIGVVLYFQSPVVRYMMTHFREAKSSPDIIFFGLIHSSLMLTAIVLLTIGSAKSKREKTDATKFRTMLIWFSIALVLIFMAIPWPFSPLTTRPYFR